MTGETERYAQSVLMELKSLLPNATEAMLATIMLREIGKLDPKISAVDISRMMDGTDELAE